MPFAGGHTAVVRCANLDEDAAIEFFVAHPEWDRHGCLATIDGHLCDAGNSPRCGNSLAQGIRGEHGERLARALGTWPS